MKGLEVTKAIRVLARPPEPGESVPDFSGMAIASKQAGFFGGTNVADDIRTAAMAAGWGCDDAEDVVRKAHTRNPPEKVDPAGVAQVCVFVVALALGLFLYAHAGRDLPNAACSFLVAYALPAVLAATRRARKIRVSLPFFLLLSVLLTMNRDFRSPDGSLIPDDIGWALGGPAAFFSCCCLFGGDVEENRIQDEARKLLEAIGRAKMGSPSSVVEVWIADGRGGWTRV